MQPAGFNRKQAVLAVFWIREQLAEAGMIPSKTPHTHLLICKKRGLKADFMGGVGANHLFVASNGTKGRKVTKRDRENIIKLKAWRKKE